MNNPVSFLDENGKAVVGVSATVRSTMGLLTGSYTLTIGMDDDFNIAVYSTTGGGLSCGFYLGALSLSPMVSLADDIYEYQGSGFSIGVSLSSPKGGVCIDIAIPESFDEFFGGTAVTSDFISEGINKMSSLLLKTSSDAKLSYAIGVPGISFHTENTETTMITKVTNVATTMKLIKKDLKRNGIDIDSFPLFKDKGKSIEEILQYYLETKQQAQLKSNNKDD